MTIDLPLESSLNRANDYVIETFDKSSLRENTMLLHRGGLSPVFKEDFANTYLDAFERHIQISSNGTISIDGITRGQTTITMSEPVRGKWRWLNRDFVVEPGEFPIHGAPITTQIRNGQLFVGNTNRGSINRRAEFFFYANVLYEIENGLSTNRQLNVGTGTWTTSTYKYGSIINNILVLTRDPPLTGGTIAFIRNFNTNTSYTVTTGSDDIYSYSIGPGFYTVFTKPILNSSGVMTRNPTCYWLNTYGVPSSFTCTATINGLMPFDGVVGSNGLSNVASYFSYIVNNHLIMYRGTPVGMCTSEQQITGPLTSFTRFTSTTTKQIYQTDSGQMNMVTLGVTPTVHKVTEFVWQANDGTIILSSETDTTIQPPVAVNLGFLSPTIEQSPVRNTNVNSIFYAGGNNANYEVQQFRGIGGITASMTFYTNGDPSMDIPINLLGPWRGEYYWGSFADGAAKYAFSTDGLVKYLNHNLSGILYPEPGTNTIFPVPSNGTILKTRTPSAMFKWSNAITATGLVLDNRTIMGYYLFSIFYGAETFFFLLDSYYLFDGENIYRSNQSPGNYAWSGSVAAIAEGLQFLASDSTMALFWSSTDGYCYAFGGDYQIRPLLDLSNVNVISSVYSPALDCYALLTDSELLLFCKGVLSSIKGTWDRLDTTLKGIVAYNGTTATIFSLYDYNTFTSIDYETSFFTIKESFVGTYKEVYIRVQQIDNYYGKLELEASSLITLDNILTKKATFDCKFTEGKKFQILKLSPALSGRGFSIKIKADFPVQIQAISIDVEPIGKTPVMANNRSMV